MQRITDRNKIIASAASKHEQLFEILKAEIEEGKYALHERLPSELDMKEIFGISADTVRKGLVLLQNAGLIYRIRYKGTFVAPRGQVDRILLVTNFGTDIREDDFGVIYGIPAFQRGLYRQCRTGRLDYSLVLMNSDEYLEHGDDLLLVQNNLSGVIFFRDPSGLLASREYLKKHDIPYLFYGSNHFAEKLAGENVFFYETRALMEMGINYLLDKGHERILFVGTEMENRYAVFREIMKEKGLNADDCAVSTRNGMLEGDPVALKKRGTAIFASRDMFALEALNGLYRAGVKVPSEMAVLGIDNYPLGANAIVPLSSIDIPITRDAGDCLHMLDELRQGKRKAIASRSRITIVSRESA